VSTAPIEKKIAKLLDYVKTLEGLQSDCLERMKNDKVYRGSVLYYLYMMADTCIALAQMVIRYKGLPKPQSYAETIDILGEHGVLPGEFAYDFARIAGFRNFLAHDYENVDFEEICKILIERLGQVREYADFLEAAL